MTGQIHQLTGQLATPSVEITASEEKAEKQKKFEEIRAKKLLEGNYLGYLITFESHEQLQPFIDLIPRLTDQEYWRYLREVWTGAEVILPDKEIWLRLLQWNRPGREHLMTGAERAALAAMTQEIKIWRGCGHKSAVRGLSWTLDRDRAAFFADYSCGPRRQLLVGQTGVEPILVEATCRTENVLAYLTARMEAEIVINPAHVSVLRTCRAPAPKKKDPLEIKRDLDEETAEISALLNQSQTILAKKK